MGDMFVTIGRALATPEYYIGMFVAVILVIIGVILLVYKPSPKPGQPEPSKDTDIKYGVGAIALGLLMVFLTRRGRSLVRTNDRYARIAGIRDVFSMFK